MNYAAVLSPIFDRHNLKPAMREAFVRLFTLFPPLKSDLPTFRRIKEDAALQSCLKDCRLETGRVMMEVLFREDRARTYIERVVPQSKQHLADGIVQRVMSSADATAPLPVFYRLVANETVKAMKAAARLKLAS